MKLSDVVCLVAQMDPGTWSRSDVDRVFESAGGLHVDIVGGDLVAGEGGWSVVAHRTAVLSRDYRFGDFMAVTVSGESDETGFRSILRACENRLGTPDLVGGPPCFASWRRPDRTVRLSFENGPAPSVRVGVSPTEPTEALESDRAASARDWAPDHAWQIVPDLGASRQNLRGLPYFPDRPVVSWDDFGTRVRRLFGSLATDVLRLAPYVQTIVWSVNRPQEPGYLLQGWFDVNQAHRLEIQHGRTHEHTEYVDYPHGPTCGDDLAAHALRAIHAAGIAHPGDLRYDGMVVPRSAAFDGLRFGVDREVRH